jgi:DNA invertase Pin-like site-specific DNA recombinase
MAARKQERPLRALGYCRVSTQEQGADGLSMAAQERAISVECERRGWTLARVHQDVASGKSRNGRHGLAAALDALASGKADALVASKLDRIARSTLDFANIMERARREGWRLVILDPALDLDTPFGRAMANIIATFAELEREMISERTRVGLEEARRRGKRMGLPDKHRIPPETVERIGELRRQGLSYRAIAGRLTEEGIPTALAKRSGGTWAAETVRQAYLATL